MGSALKLERVQIKSTRTTKISEKHINLGEVQNTEVISLIMYLQKSFQEIESSSDGSRTLMKWLLAEV